MSSDVYGLLRKPFDNAAYSADTSRGFELTSIKAAYVLERMNEVFGLCGTGWRYAHSTFDEINKEIITWVAVQYAVEDGGCGRVEWDAMIGHWRVVEGAGWSEPIYTVGGNQVGKGGIPVTDAKKSAITNGIGKAISVIGVGSDVFKGLVRVGNKPPQQRQQSSQPAQQARERAKAPTTGKLSRPMTPEQVKKALVIKSGDGKAAASTKQAEFVARLVQEIWADDIDGEEKYHDCLEYLTGVRSATELTKGQASAFITYLRAEPESTENWGLHSESVEEMKAVLEVATA